MEVRPGLNAEARSLLPIRDLESPLSSGWERCLDLKSGLIFFKNWETGRRTYARPGLREPRLSSDHRAACEELELFPFPSNSAAARGEDRSRDLSKSKCSSPSSLSSSSVNFGGGDGGEGKRKRQADDDVASERGGGGGKADVAPENAGDDGSPRGMVLAGCPRCLMYVMFCKSNRKCPNCGHGFRAGQGIGSCKRRA